MKNFEEQFTAWTDGRMDATERAAFESALKNRTGAEAERAEILRMGELLRAHHGPVDLKNPEFFNQSILRRIEEESPAPREAAPSRRASIFAGWRLLGAGAFFVIVAIGLFEFLVPKGPYISNGRDAYMAEVLEAHTGSSSIYASSFHAKSSNVTVVWIDGLPYIPETYAAQ